MKTRKRIDAGENEELDTSGSGVDERTGIDVALDQYAGEGSVDVLERFQLLEAADIGVGGSQVGQSLLISAGLRVGFLLGDGIRLAQILPAIGGDFGDVELSRGSAGGWRGPATIPDRLREYQCRRADRPWSRGCQCLCTSAGGIHWCERRWATLRRPAKIAGRTSSSSGFSAMG